ncbi:MAG: hypothetical protein SCK28_14565, partial [Bacillota bacterium]|nr:hypothetical protein [Bacillota bacterium]
NSKSYQDEAVKIVRKALKQWKVTPKSHKIEICSSYIFDKVRLWLKDNNYSWMNSKIGSPLQAEVQQSFFEYLISLGLTDNYLKHTRYAYGFHRLLQWVYADKEKRQQLCKTCWKSYRQWGNVEYSFVPAIALEEQQCLKCNNKIDKGAKAKEVKYETKSSNKLVIHNDC